MAETANITSSDAIAAFRAALIVFLSKVRPLLEETSGGKEEKHEIGTRLTRPTKQPSLVELALPHFQHLDPQRVRCIRAALQKLELLQQEGVMLTMPDLLISN